MHTTLFLVRAGDTEWEAAGRLLGRHDVILSQAGRAQADETARVLAQVAVAEVLSSPMLRAVETAERIARPHRLEVARDGRLAALHAGRWEGRPLDELASDPAWTAFARGEGAAPGGESLADVQQRAVGSIEQVVDDNQLGANLVVVAHRLVLQTLLAHYLRMPLAEHARLELRPASVAALRFEPDRAPPRLMALGCASVVRAARAVDEPAA